MRLELLGRDAYSRGKAYHACGCKDAGLDPVGALRTLSLYGAELVDTYGSLALEGWAARGL